MDRRNLLKAIGGLTLLASSNKSFAINNKQALIKPKVLSEGDKVSIIAPGSAVSSPDDHNRAIEILDKLNLKHEFAPNVKIGSGYKTRSIKERVEDLHFAFESDSKAVIAIRGGYGSASMLPYIDFNLIKRNPKIFCGYSDVTALHLAINKVVNMVTFHGPVLLSKFDNYTFENFKMALFGYSSNYAISNPKSKSLREANPITIISAGKAKGKLLGGNLSLLTSLLGSEYCPSLQNNKDRILFIEDVGEAPYKIHRMLTQLKLAGYFDSSHISGLIIGKCDDCTRNSASTWDQSEMEVYYEFFNSVDFPVIHGFLIGHTSSQTTLPIGVEVEIDTDNKRVVLLEKPHS
ncbi:LD-carboxypeptidase [Candidatus Kapabacteria bacterium]|nr:LD-carboxypeptidase [Candidatus Kapabacteria bacterium]